MSASQHPPMLKNRHSCATHMSVVQMSLSLHEAADEQQDAMASLEHVLSILHSSLVQESESSQSVDFRQQDGIH